MRNPCESVSWQWAGGAVRDSRAARRGYGENVHFLENRGECFPPRAAHGIIDKAEIVTFSALGRECAVTARRVLRERANFLPGRVLT